ncbi:hypothetical protein FRC12_009557 [Ceratobasidium sp. 428]|nr:hypothetical protein FRC12_009557 [Ceratobasidium sp. 428]
MVRIERMYPELVKLHPGPMLALEKVRIAVDGGDLNSHLDIENPQLHILAHITEAEGAEGDETTEQVPFTKLDQWFVLDVSTIQHVVGRVEMRGMKALGERVIVDCGEALECGFHLEEAEHEDYED